jgi:7,8-dihydro-6-hydroxymethylpterin dimethyltransferase
MLRDYVFHESTRSFCSKCHQLCDAKVIIKNGSAYLLKNCLVHGEELAVFEEDASYLIEKQKFAKPGNKLKPDTAVKDGCPYDCGLCPDHEQHTCIGLIEITRECDLGCPVCYADSGSGGHLPLDRIEAMMDFFSAREGGKPEILQIGGGEPTTHPDLEKILRMAKRKRFRYVMLNTNGLRIAEDKAFAGFLASLTPGFEVYLQFDGLKEKTYERLRGRKLLASKLAAIDNLREARVPVTLVATVVRDVNDTQIGEIVEFGLASDYVRGVNFQPVAYFGRGAEANVPNRVTLSGIRRAIESQTGGLFRKEDIVPLPCDVDRVAVMYAVKKDGEFVPITSRIKVEGYLELIDNTMDFRAEDVLKNAVARSITKGIGCDCFKLIDEVTAILPSGYVKWSPKERADFINTNTFRITISSFIDMYNFDAKSIRQECVHVITPDLKRIPFSAYNMLHRSQG